MCELLVYFCVKLSDCFSVAHCTLSAAARQALSAGDLNGEMCHCERGCERAAAQKRYWERKRTSEKARKR